MKYLFIFLFISCQNINRQKINAKDSGSTFLVESDTSMYIKIDSIGYLTRMKCDTVFIHDTIIIKPKELWDLYFLF